LSLEAGKIKNHIVSGSGLMKNHRFSRSGINAILSVSGSGTDAEIVCHNDQMTIEPYTFKN